MKKARKLLKVIVSLFVASFLVAGTVPSALADSGSGFLADISATGGQLSPAFQPDFYEYQLIPEAGSSLSTVTVAPADQTDIVTINGAAATTVTLGLGDTDIRQAAIEVVSQDGQRSSAYTVSFAQLVPRTEYAVTFDSQGGSDVASANAAAGETVAEPAPPAKEGFTFAGWYADASLETPYDFSAAMPDHDITLYAAWNAVSDDSAAAASSEPAASKALEMTAQVSYNSGDVAKIRAFLVQNSAVSGQTNAQVLNYNPDDPSTWGEVAWDSGRMQSILWEECSLAGSLDLSGLTSLQELYLYDNSITGLNISGCSALQFVDCSYNRISALNASSLPELMMLDCSYNNLQQLNLSGDPALLYVDCSGNAQLTTLNLSGLASLAYVFCSSSGLTSLDLSGCGALELLDCSLNALTSLNTSQSGNLLAVDCSGNKLTSLNISSAALDYLDCSGNKLQSVSAVVNGKPVKLTASGSGYVELLYDDTTGAAMANAVPVTPSVFGSWTKAGAIVSSNKDFSLTAGGDYTANFVQARKGTVVNCTTSVNVRSGPGTGYSVLGSAKKGAVYTVTGQSGSWYKIDYNGKTGYISATYLSVSGTTNPPAAQTGTVVNCTTSVNVRSGAGTGYAVIGSAPKGAKYTVTGQSGSWYKIDYNGKTGYISSTYLSVSGTTNPPPTIRTGTVVNCTTSVNVRSGAGTSYAVLGSAKKGATYTVTGQSGSWYKIDYNGKTGYISSTYLSVK